MEKKKIVNTITPSPSMVSETLDVSMKCVQYMLFLSNFLFVMVALLLIAIGTIIKVTYIDFEYFLETSYFSPSDLIIFSGFVIFFIAFFGCWGAIRESVFLINVYSGCLIFVLVMEILAVIFSMSMRFNMRATITENMKNVFEEAKSDEKLMDVFDFAQSQLHCCGLYNMKDWRTFPQYNDSNTLPQSCCPSYDYFSKHNKKHNCEIMNAGNSSNPPFMKPCIDQVVYLISETAYLLGSGAFCVAFIQVIGIFFARLLSKTIKDIKTQRLVDAEKRKQQIYSQFVLAAHLNEKIPQNATASEA